MKIIKTQYLKEHPTLGDGKTITSIKVSLENGSEMIVPLSETNADYNKIMKQVKAGTLTIKDAD
tara:strand:+ start:991 stop:1182 length:192 start_codon:yes stop_codon:yes gene_type:complete